MTTTIVPNYLVIGAGAMGMAFVDTLLSDTKATVAMVDRYARPGGHWTIAYPFVRLHQPSSFYGVNSRPLGEGRIDQVGLNKGLAELATVDEVCAYYGLVMQQTFLPSGRVTYYPKHEYLGDGEFQSAVTGKKVRVGQETCIVDATYMKVKVPAMSPPSYQVSDDVELVTPNDLPKISRPFSSYTVVGAGKTGIDACLWLMTNGVDPKNITWIMPRDSWFLERGSLQPGPEFAGRFRSAVADTQKATMSASSVEDLFHRLETSRLLMRLDKNIWPTSYRCATLSMAELEHIKTVGTIVRKGHVVSLSTNAVVLEKGKYIPIKDTLYIDCTADALAKLDPVPVFSDKHIILQTVRHCQQVFSAAFIAHVEASYATQQAKNDLCRVVPHPNDTIDYMITRVQSQQNALRWSTEPKTVKWLQQARLDWLGQLLLSSPEDPVAAAENLKNSAVLTKRLRSKLMELISQLSQEQAANAKAQLSNF